MSAEDRKAARDEWRASRPVKDVDHRKDFDPVLAGDAIEKRVKAKYAAAEAVRPIVGVIVMDAKGMETAAGIYKFALTKAGVPINGVHESAYPALLASELKRRQAADARPTRRLDARHSIDAIFRRKSS